MQAIIQREKLFVASCLALLVTSLSFGIRAGILNRLGVQFHLSAQDLAVITATVFWGFPLATIIGGMVVDIIGMKRLLAIAFIFHLLGIFINIFATGYWSLFISFFLIGIANGTVEAACNPLVATIYPDNKTTKLNHFHLWFPAGTVIGTLIVFFFDKLGISWQIQVATMLIPTLIYGYLFLRLKIPVTERVSSGVTTAGMYRAVTSPLFIFMFICMFGTAITELFTGQWIDVLLRNVASDPILILTLTTGIMAIGRAFAGPVVHRFSPQGVLLISAILAALGMYLLTVLGGTSIYLGAIVFGMGVCYFWPTMLGFVAENIPRSGALGLNLMGGAGMLAVSIYMVIMGGFYDRKIIEKLPSGASLDSYRSALPGTPEAAAYANAQLTAGPDILQATNIIPVILIVAFSGLYLYMRKRKVTNPLPALGH